MFKKSKILKVLTITPFFVPAFLVACSGKSSYDEFDKNGKAVPLNVEQLKNYLDFEVNEEAVENTTVAVALKSIQDADEENRMFFLNSFLKPVNEIIPKNFSYKIEASENIEKNNSIIVKITAINKKDSSRLEKTFTIENFKVDQDISEEDYEKIYNNLLESSDLSFLIPGIKDENLKESDKKNRTNYVNYTNKIMGKYNEGVFKDNPVANLYYAGNFEAGGNTDDAKTKQKAGDFQLISQENKIKELKAIEEARDLIYKKEIQQIFDKELGKTIDGYTDAKAVRTVIQKLLFLASAYQINVEGNIWYKNEELKATVKAIMDDFATNYFYKGQQQFINWWFYEIGIPKDLAKLLSVLKADFPLEDLKKWTEGVRYFLPNARYGGAAPTAILNYRPVGKKRLQTGANVIDNAKPILVSAAISKDKLGLEDAILAMYDNLFRDFVDHEDGFYLDGSFIQHGNIPYVGSYGEVLFTGMADIFEYFKGTKLSIAKDPRFTKIYKFIELSVMPFMFKMSISDGLSGRSLVRANHSDKAKGINILGSLAIFVKEAPEEYKARLHNFIWEQAKDFKDEEIKALGTKYKVRDIFVNSIIEIKNSDKLPTSFRNLDWQYYETNYFNKNHEPSSQTPLTEGKDLVPVGVDLAIANNGMVFTKNQDRFVWKKPDSMLNINLRGRKMGFAEASLGENLESYYHFDGATLLHTSKNHQPYNNEYWTTVNRDEIPGTSSIKTTVFDEIDKYRIPEPLKDDANKKAKEEYDKIIEKREKALQDKRKKIEEEVSLKTNKTFSNGIIFENTGIVKSEVHNYNNSLRTNKTYLMVGDMTLVIGNLNKKLSTVNTTIENRMNHDANFKDGKWENLDVQSFNQQKLGEKDLFVFGNTNTKEKNGYVILGSNKAKSSRVHVEKYPRIANDTRNKVTDILLNRTFDKLSFNHKTNNTFAYAIIPNYDEAKAVEYQKLIDNIEIIKNDANYIVLKYKKAVGDTFENYYYINSFFEEDKTLTKLDEEFNKIEGDKRYDAIVKKGLDVPGLDLNFKIYSPLTMVVKQIEGFKNLEIVTSSDLNEKSYQFQINKVYKTIDSRIITNPHKEIPKVIKASEVQTFNILNTTAIKVDTNLGEFNNYNHNVWIKLGDFND